VHPTDRMRPERVRLTRTRRSESSEMTEAEAIRLAQRGDAGAFRAHLPPSQSACLCVVPANGG